MATLRHRVDELEVQRRRMGDVRSMSTAEIERVLIESYGYLPSADEMQILIDREKGLEATERHSEDGG